MLLPKEKFFKLGYTALLNQKQKFALIVLIVLENDAAKQLIS